MKLRKKRRLKNKTDYKKRLILLKGNYLRFVVRKSNRYLIMQFIKSTDARDKTIGQVNTKELLKFGWPQDRKGSLKSLSAAYLGGFLLGKKTKIKEKAILDSGLIPNTKGSRIYAGVKGLADSGIDIKYNEKVVPDLERIENGKIDSDLFKRIKELIIKNG